MSNAEKIFNEYFQEKFTPASNDAMDEFVLYPVDLTEGLFPKFMVLEMIEKAFNFGKQKQKEACEAAYQHNSSGKWYSQVAHEIYNAEVRL
jgi:hypothetical protein